MQQYHASIVDNYKEHPTSKLQDTIAKKLEKKSAIIHDVRLV